jgi:ParB family chromosome partitioning protein
LKDNSVQVERNLSAIDTRKIVAEQAGESVGNVQRLLRLNELAPELLAKVDTDELKLTPAVELSYLPQEQQKQVAELIEIEGRTPSLSQAQEIKRLSQEKRLDEESLGNIFIQPKPQERRALTLKGERLEKFFTEKYTPAQFEDIVFKALDEYFKRMRQKERQKEEIGAR